METPWQELERTGAELRQMQPCIQGEVHPDAHVLGVLQLGEGSVVLPGTVIEGHVRIGRGCRIGPNAYLRGETSIGDNWRRLHFQQFPPRCRRNPHALAG